MDFHGQAIHLFHHGSGDFLAKLRLSMVSSMTDPG
jgi:hypothetical protein